MSELNQLPGKVAMLLGFLGAFAVISLLLNIFLGMALLKGGTFSVGSGNGGSGAVVPNQPSAMAGDHGAPAGPPAEVTFDITDSDHIRGAKNAKVTLVEFSDFECPFCSRLHPTMKQILEEYSDEVRLVYKHFPLTSIHPLAQKAAEASECAAEQNKFWEMHDQIFENQTSLSIANFKQWARNMGLNGSQFDSCLDDGKYADKVAADTQEGSAKGVSGTPATFVNGKLVSGALPYASFKQLIDAELGG